MGAITASQTGFAWCFRKSGTISIQNLAYRPTRPPNIPCQGLISSRPPPQSARWLLKLFRLLAGAVGFCSTGSRSPTFQVSRGGGLNEGWADLPDSPAPVAQRLERGRARPGVDLQALRKDQGRLGKHRVSPFPVAHSLPWG